jgi:hypothetical protein
VHNLRHLAEMVTSCAGPYLRFDCEYREAVVLDAAAAFADTSAVRGAGPPAAGGRGMQVACLRGGAQGMHARGAACVHATTAQRER